MKAISWDEISNQDLNLIRLIVERAMGATSADSTLSKADKATLVNDLAAYHLAQPLDLDGLLKAPDFDLLHDVHGIHICMKPEYKEMNGLFIARHAIQLTDDQKAEKLGKYMIKALGLKFEENGLTWTSFGEKSTLGLGRVVQRIIKDELYLEGGL